MKNSFVSPQGPKALVNKTGINIMILSQNSWKIVSNLMHGLSVWLRTDSNPSDINCFQNYTRTIYLV